VVALQFFDSNRGGPAARAETVQMAQSKIAVTGRIIRVPLQIRLPMARSVDGDFPPRRRVCKHYLRLLSLVNQIFPVRSVMLKTILSRATDSSKRPNCVPLIEFRAWCA
jgi:hypothetical protein